MSTFIDPKQSISYKFNQSLNRVISVIVLVFSLSIISYQVYDYRQTAQHRLSEIAALAKTSLPYSMWNMDANAMDEVVKALTLGKDVVYVALLMDGKMVKEVAHGDYHKSGLQDAFWDQYLFLSASESISYDGNDIGEVKIVLSMQGMVLGFLVNVSFLLLFTIALLRLISNHSLKANQQYIFKPLSVLEEKATLIASGKLETRLDNQSQDEIGSLSSSLDKMRQSIIKLFDDLKKINLQLEEHNKNLEVKVAERTRELAESLKEQEVLNANILDSIEYAHLIQSSILPSRDNIHAGLPDSFCYWLPKDIVGGDIYYYEQTKNKIVYAVIDCTGHGVPGAFMTMIAATSLKTIIDKSPLDSAGKILTQLNSMVKKSLRQDQEDCQSDDGMDAGLCIIDPQQQQVVFAGAKTPLFLLENGQMQKFNGDRMSIGYKGSDTNYAFSDAMIPFTEESCFYMTTDGMLDQKGGSKGLPFGKKRFISQLMEQQQQSMQDQERNLLAFFDEYAEGFDHQDDVTVVGFRTRFNTPAA